MASLMGPLGIGGIVDLVFWRSEDVESGVCRGGWMRACYWYA